MPEYDALGRSRDDGDDPGPHHHPSLIILDWIGFIYLFIHDICLIYDIFTM